MFSTALAGFLAFCVVTAQVQEPIDLTGATIICAQKGEVPIAATVLKEEIAKRANLDWPIQTELPKGPAIFVLETSSKKIPKMNMPSQLRNLKPEGYGIDVTSGPSGPIVWVVGADKRGALYGVGKLLRTLSWKPGSVQMTKAMPIASSPAYPMRGHQLGYRHTANTYDAWTVQQYDQYIRDLALFGANCIENIPFQDDRQSPVMKISRREMNIAISQICDKYDLDYWVWIPAVFDLNDKQKLAEHMADYERFLDYTPRLDHIFFPGGDPGDNPPELVMPYLDDLSKLVAKYHPKAKIWISLQGFDKKQVDTFYAWLDEHMPEWMGGLVYGPSSPPLSETRVRLPKKYPIRHYPDVTHNRICQYPIPWWDQAYSLTEGREAINPRPVYYAGVHNLYAPYTCGFLSYSDGSHDDVNKTIWSAMAWDPKANVRDVMIEYANVFFRSEDAPEIADAILALEKNWEGPIATNGGVDSTVQTWRGLESGMGDNWRWQMCTLRAYYDFYVRHRGALEQRWEQDANAAMLASAEANADTSIDTALAALKRADEPPSWEISGIKGADVRARIADLCEQLWKSIGFQSSVEKYKASGLERGAILDFVDYPLNNRRWLEDELAKARQMPAPEKVARLHAIASWEDPGPGGYYDYLGDITKMQHVVHGEESNTDPATERHVIPDWMWWEEGATRVRQSWIGYMNWPVLRYEALDPNADYVIRCTGYKECLLRVDGQLVKPTVYGKEIGEIKEFPVPRELYKDAVIILTFDRPDESQLNWRQHSRLNEVWLVKK